MNARRRWSKVPHALAILALILGAIWFLSDEEKKTLDAETRAGLPGQFVALPGGVTHYELSGPQDAPLVVLVHGFSVPYYIWDPTFKALAEAGFRVLRYDLYGRGYSDRPEADYDLDLFTQQLQELLSVLDVQGPVDLVGLSFGGPITAAYANRHPGQIRRLTLVDPQVAPVSAADIFPLNVPLLGEYLMEVYMAPAMLPKSQSDDFYRPERFPDWETRYRDQLQYRGFRRAILSSIRNMPKMEAAAEYEMLGHASIPVMLVWGQDDKTVSAADINTIRRTIPTVEFHAIKEAGHLPHYEQSASVNTLLIDFLSSQGTVR